MDLNTDEIFNEAVKKLYLMHVSHPYANLQMWYDDCSYVITTQPWLYDKVFELANGYEQCRALKKQMLRVRCHLF